MADRTPKIRLQRRATIAFALMALASAVTVAGISYSRARTILISQREKSALRQSFLNARAVRAGLREEPVTYRKVLASLSTGKASYPLILADERWFVDSVTVGGDDIPRALQDRTTGNIVSVQRTVVKGRPYFMIGIPLPEQKIVYFEAFPFAELDRTLGTLAAALGTSAAIATVIAAAVGVLVTRRVVRPLGDLAVAADRIAHGDLAARLDGSGDRSLTPLVTSFNDMAAALQDRVDRDTRFASNVSHELRSPLTAIRASLGLVTSRVDSMPERARSGVELLENQVDRFERMVLDLLDISKLDGSKVSLHTEALDMVELEVGYGLINVVDSSKSGDLLERISSIRKQFALDLGIVVPSVHIRDNLQLAPGEYRFLIKGNKIGGGILKPDALLAMDPGEVRHKVDGIATKEPAFGLDAVWISPMNREKAEMAGYTVVDLPTVMATHVTEMIRTHAHELLGRQEVSTLVDNFKKTHPKVVEDLIPDALSLGGVVRVLQNLLKEQVSIWDLLTIFETLADEAGRTKDLDLLTEAVRKNLSRSITAKYSGEEAAVSVLTFDSRLEELVANALLQTEQGVQLVMDPQSASKMISNIAQQIENHPEIASQPILLTSPTVRRHIFKLVSRFIPQLIVLSHNELTADVKVQSVANVGLN